MKKRNNSIALFMVFVLLLSLFAITMVACAPQKPDVPDVPDTPGDTPSNPGDKPGEPNPKPDNPNDELIDFALDGNSVYSADGLGANASNLRFRISSATKNTIPVVGKKDSATILLLAMEGYNAKDIHTVGRYSMFVQDGKLVVNATDTKAMQFAVARLGEMMNADGFKLAKDFNESCMFDNYRSTSGKLVHLTDEDIALLDVAEGIYANGERIKGFTPYVSELNTTSTKLDGYPTITAAATSNKAIVSITQPKDNGGVGIVTVSNSGKTRTYLIKVELESVYMDASVINKNNTRGTITFVIDDADQQTAAYVSNTIFKVNGNVKASYAIITNKLVTMQKTSDGEEWKKDENGRYVYTTNDSVVEFWRGILSSGRADFTSHSHTHLYWGDDDGGGVFDYVLNNGNHATSQYFPKGNVTMELLASKQVLQDLFGVESNIFIKPGVGAKLSQYYLDLLEDAGFYLGARNTASNPSNPIKMVNSHKDFVNIANRFNIKSYMIQHYNTSAEKATDASSLNSDCLSAGIPYWTDYIDTAIDNGGWACFCIHLIRPDTHTGSGHYIYESQADALFAHADAYGKDVWFATLEEASKYYFLRSGTTVSSELVSDNRIELFLTDTEVSPLYNDVELTLRVSVPEHWEAAVVDKITYEVEHDENGAYIIINALRGARLNIEGISTSAEDDADFEYEPIRGDIGLADVSGGSLTLTESTVVYYNKDDVLTSSLAIKLAGELSKTSGLDIKALPDDNIIGEGYIRITSIDDVCSSLNNLKRLAGRVEAYQAYLYDGGLHLVATTEQALSIGVDSFINSLTFNTLTIDGEAVFISKDGELLDREMLNSDTTLSSIRVNGVPIDSFSPDKNEYVYYMGLFNGYPTISCDCYFGLSHAVVSQPSAENLGECKITVYSFDGSANGYYLTIKDNSQKINAEIVHRGGADAVVSFVFDDGNHKTADYLVHTALVNHPRLKVSLGLITDRIASLVYDAETDSWKRDEDGRYVYVQKQSEVEFWRNILLLSNDRLEFLSHSHTHAYFGEDNEGGVYEYLDNKGATQTSARFPKGNITKEIAASKQILEDIFGQESNSYILPGLPVAKLSDLYYNLLRSASHYIGARGGFGVGNTIPDAVLPVQMRNMNVRYNTPALTTQYFKTNNKNILDTNLPAQVYLDNGIDAWEEYIDNAVNQGGWACFLLHNVVEDNSTPNIYAIFESQAEALFDYTDSYGERIWIATYDEAQIYYNQWSSASVQASLSNDLIRVDLSHRESGEVYNMAMTVRLSVPEEWEMARIGEELVEITEEHGERYIYVDVVPNDSIYVERAYTSDKNNDDADFELVPIR